MTMQIWQSSGSQDYASGPNWSGAAAPGAVNDEAFFPSGNAVSCTVSMNQTGDLLDLLYTDVGYSGSLGGVGNPLIISATKAWFRGSGAVYFRSDATTALCIVDMASPSTVVDISGVGTTITTLIILRGTVTISSTVIVTNLFVGYHSNQQSDVNLTIGSSVGTIAKYKQNGGYVDSSNTTTTVGLIDEGTCKKTLGTFTTLDMRGGFCRYDSTTTQATLNGLGGVFDLTQSPGQKTITTLYRYPGFTLRRVTDANVHIVATDIDLRTDTTP